jgi:hypothetical protein
MNLGISRGEQGQRDASCISASGRQQEDLADLRFDAALAFWLWSCFVGGNRRDPSIARPPGAAVKPTKARGLVNPDYLAASSVPLLEFVIAHPYN